MKLHMMELGGVISSHQLTPNWTRVEAGCAKPVSAKSVTPGPRPLSLQLCMSDLINMEFYYLTHSTVDL